MTDSSPEYCILFRHNARRTVSAFRDIFGHIKTFASEADAQSCIDDVAQDWLRAKDHQIVCLDKLP